MATKHQRKNGDVKKAIKERKAAEAELAKRRKMNEERRKRWSAKVGILKERLAPAKEIAAYGGRAIKSASVKAAPYVRAAAREVGAGAKTTFQYGQRYVQHMSTPTMPGAMFVLTPRGRSTVQAFMQGDYTSIPAESARARLLLAAHRNGYFTLASATGALGQIGEVATQLLVEDGLLMRRALNA